MKKSVLFLLMPLMAITLNSCEKEPDKGNDNSNGSGKLVKSIVYETVHDGSSFIRDEEYKYDDQQRLIGIDYSISGNDNYSGTTTFSYSGNTVSIEYRERGSTEEFLYTFDDDGYLIKEVYDDGNYQTFEYSNGCVSKVIYGGEELVNYTWSDGNIVKNSYSQNPSGGQVTITFTHHNAEDRLNVNLMQEANSTDLRFKGMHSRDLLASETNTMRYSDGSESVTLSTFEYTFDDDGYPTGIVESSTRRTPDNPDGDTVDTTITITYH
jgi:hypothetical protein